MTKYIVSSVLIFFEIIILSVAILVPISISEGESDIWIIGSIILGSISVSGQGCALIMLTYYFSSIHSVLTGKEMVVYRGFIKKREKIVPLRTITNSSYVRGPLDNYLAKNLQILTPLYKAN